MFARFGEKSEAPASPSCSNNPAALPLKEDKNS
jgi:hypothetical protein